MTLGRVIWIVLDGVGIGALPDAAAYGDAGAATIQNVALTCGGLSLPNLEKIGLGCLADIKGVSSKNVVCGTYGRMAEKSAGKDSIVGHWELAGIVVEQPFATFPDGFPQELVDRLTRMSGMQFLGNVPASGTSILKKYGQQHLQTGSPILYTSVDSVLQIAAHEEVLSKEQLYELCQLAKPLTDEYNIARVIARPFNGTVTSGFRRTPHRKDFPKPPPEPTILEVIAECGYTVAAIGKIKDLFAGRGISTSVATEDNHDGMSKIITGLQTLESGLLLANLIDFDMAYGHRNDAQGFGRALEEFDKWLPQLYSVMNPEDLLLVTADHGCDPTTPGTDHTREYVPLLVWSKKMRSETALEDRGSFADVAATLAEFYKVKVSLDGESFLASLQL